jgi:hypothetical protein
VNAFTSSIIRNHLMAPAQASQLVIYMIDRWPQVWKIPEDVEEIVNIRLSSLGIGSRDALTRMGEQTDIQ